MSKRPLQILGVALVVAAVAWVLSSHRNTTNDEERYQQWQRPVDSWARVVFLERHLPTSLSKALHLPALEQRYIDKNEKLGEALVASGYLTNVHISVTNAGASRTQIANRLRKATQGSRAKWEFYVRSNAVVVLKCRPEDAATCVRAAEGK